MSLQNSHEAGNQHIPTLIEQYFKKTRLKGVQKDLELKCVWSTDLYLQPHLPHLVLGFRRNHYGTVLKMLVTGSAERMKGTIDQAIRQASRILTFHRKDSHAISTRKQTCKGRLSTRRRKKAKA